jgi:hypothetical protein
MGKREFWITVLAFLILVFAIMPVIALADEHVQYRSRAVVSKFKISHECPATGRIEKHCKGYVVDHVCSLFNGGRDNTINLQWQSFSESKKKDRIENTKEGKKLFCTPLNSTPERRVFNKKHGTHSGKWVVVEK